MATMAQAIKEAFGERGGRPLKGGHQAVRRDPLPGRMAAGHAPCSPLRLRRQQPESVRSSPPTRNAFSTSSLTERSSCTRKRCTARIYGRLTRPRKCRRRPSRPSRYRLASSGISKISSCHQLDALEEGLTFEGRQVKCDVGRVDIMGRGADGATVVVELKVGEAKDSAPSGRSPATWDGHLATPGCRNRSRNPRGPRIFLKACSTRPKRCRTWPFGVIAFSSPSRTRAFLRVVDPKPQRLVERRRPLVQTRPNGSSG